LIRSADISTGGQVRIGVGATLVRLSDPDGEAAETTAKAAAMLGALGAAGERSDAGPPAATPQPGQIVGNHPSVKRALDMRNSRLADYWFQTESARARAVPVLSGRKVLVVDAEDTFTAMLGQHLRSLGLRVFIDPYHHVRNTGGMDLVVVGPGPGDPRDTSNTRITALRQLIRHLIGDAIPFLAVCLGHQVLSSALGLEIVRNTPPHQGMQREVWLFGRTERVGLYNTYSARCDRDSIDYPGIPGGIEVSRDPCTGEVHALRCARFASVQFHPESLLTQHGSAILAELVTPLVRETRCRPRDN
jgi:2-amino-4-deoxychorismate synthase